MAYIQDVQESVPALPEAGNLTSFVVLSQNENGRRLNFKIVGVDIPSGSTATFSGTKPDGVVYSTTGTISGNIVTVNEDIQMTAVAGSWDAKIRVLNGGNVIASAKVRITIDADPVAPGSIPSDSQLDGIVAECQAYAESARSDAYGSPLTASTAAGMIDKTRVYVYTGSETGYTNGHWYYWDGTAWADGGAYNSSGIQTDTTLSVPGMAADAKAAGDEITDLKEDFEALESEVSTLADATTLSTYNNDKAPYLFRASGGGKFIGGIEKDTIVGGTVAWNQRINAFTPRTEQNKGLTITYTTTSITINGTATDRGNFPLSTVDKNNGTLLSNHIYYMRACPMGGSGSTYHGGIAGLVMDTGTGGIYKHTYSWESSSLRFDFYQDVVFNNATFYPQYVDLTQLLGSTIADYIYTLEQANTGAGIAKLKSWGFFTEDYYPYDAGTLKSVESLISHDMVGFNQWDEEWENGYINGSGQEVASNQYIRSKNFIPIIEGADYYIKTPAQLKFMGYDANKNFVKFIDYTWTNEVINNSYLSGVKYVRFYNATSGGITTYNHDICINLSSSKNGTYEPYEKHSYPLDSDLTLRGIPKLDSANQLYCDGDIYKADGSVTRKYGTRAYQSGDESLTDAITDGTNTVYKLSTTTTETADPYQNPQIVDKYGTEEYVTTGIVPVGHDTDYYLDADSVLTPPSTAGTYSLKVTVASDGSKSYSWVSD